MGSWQMGDSNQRRGWLAVGAVVGVGIGLMTWSAGAQPLSSGAGLENLASSGLVVQLLPSEGRGPSLVVVDSARKVIGVYHIHPETGSIELRSIRTIRWDLEMSEFNSSSPLPEEIRKGLARAQ